MEPLPERRRSLKDLDPTKEAARELVGRTLQRMLALPSRGGEEWLAAQLRQELIAVRYTHDRGGVLRGVSFEVNGVAVRGQEVGYKAAQLREALAEPAVALSQVPEVPPELPAGSKPPRPEPKQRRGKRGPAR